MPIELLCAIEPAALGSRLAGLLRDCELVPVEPTPDAVAEVVRAHTPDLVVLSPGLAPRPLEGWIRELGRLPERPEVVVVHDREDPQFRAALLRAGCLAVLYSGLPIDELAQTLQVLIERRHDLLKLSLKSGSPLGRCSLDDFVSQSPSMQEFVAFARRVVRADTSLLLLGETGTGKERLARAIHEEGARSAGPFVAVNCGALPETLLESELFGFEKGAFTGATRTRKGYFQQADGGTLFLDEIAEIPVHLQVKLLRAIERRQVQRVGGERSLPVDVRVMAATNRDLEAEIAAGRFRKDLYYRLAVVTLSIPPLRERAEDVPALFESYVEHFRVVLNKPMHGVHEDAMRALVEYAWPGNVRELINVAERAVLLAPGPRIRLEDLPRAISRVSPPVVDARSLEGLVGDGQPPAWTDKPLRDARREVMLAFERAYLTRLLQSTGGRISASAHKAGVNERSLYELMQRHHLEKRDFRPRPAAERVARPLAPVAGEREG